jgi:putative photosynthetic complex assembly protein
MPATATHPSFPRGTLLAAAGIIGLSLAAAAIGRVTGPVATPPVSAVVQSRLLRFDDRPDGSVAVLDAATGRLVAVEAPGTNGFLRATLRTLARERLTEHLGAHTPFRLTHWADGRLTLDDPATHRHLELEAFGITNMEAFARLMPAAPRGSAPQTTGGAKP